jgi:hypothetical protein
LFRLADGKIAEFWRFDADLSLMMQLPCTPPASRKFPGTEAIGCLVCFGNVFPKQGPDSGYENVQIGEQITPATRVRTKEPGTLHLRPASQRRYDSLQSTGQVQLILLAPFRYHLIIRKSGSRV